MQELVDTAFLDCFHPEDGALLAQIMRALLSSAVAPSAPDVPQ